MVAVQKALDLVVHLPLNVTNPDISSLKERYHVRYNYPLYVLCDQSGSVITRWEGYTGADRFIAKLRQSLVDQTTIEQRIARLKDEPSYRDVIVLAQYSASIGEFIVAKDYYREAERYGKRDYSFEVFSNIAQAAFREQMSFDEATAAADSFLALPSAQPKQIVRVIQTIVKLARTRDKIDQVGKYLDMGIAISSTETNAGFSKQHNIFMADKMLYIDHDTVAAISYRKKIMGERWQAKPSEFYGFALWCLERKINLDEASLLARQAVQRISPGSARATVIVTLAKITFAQNNIDEALIIISKAIEEDPSNQIALSLRSKWINWRDRDKKSPKQ